MRQRIRGWLYILSLMVPAVHAAEYEGRLDWSRTAPLGTLASGVVEQVNVRVGDRVQRGQVLARLDQRALAADVRSAEAQVAYLQAALEEAARELERTQEMYDRTLLADHDLQLSQIAHAKAEAALRAAEATQAQARLLFDYSMVRAPFDGVVVQREAEPGQVVVTELSAVTLLVVAATGEMVARVELAAGQGGAIRDGQQATVRLDGQSLKGSVRQVVSGSGGTLIDVAFEVPAADGIVPGRRVQVVLP